jgi:hypothetical protein
MVTLVGEILPNNNDQPLPLQPEFVLISKQYPHPRLALISENAGARQFGEAWSIMRYIKYGVLMIERRNGIAYRIGQGTISKSKWDQEYPVEKLIVPG